LTIAETAATPVYRFADRAWEQFLELEPLMATAQGDERWDDRLGDPGPAGRVAEQALADEWDTEIARLELTVDSVEDSVTLALMRVVTARMRRAHELRLWEMDGVDQYGGPQGLIGDLARLQRIDTPERLQRLLARLAAYPGWLAAYRENLAEGIASGRTAAGPVVERCIAQTRRMVEAPASESPLLAANPNLGDEQRAMLLEAIERDVMPPLRDWLTMLEDYADHARSGDGVCYLADGNALYRHHIQSWTTLAEDPQAIHDYGLARLEEVETEAKAIAAELGYEDIGALRRHLNEDAENHVTEPGDLVGIAEELIERAQAVAPEWFGRLPRDGCEVRAVEAHMEQDAPPAFYMQPSEDGSRKGVYFINTYDPAARHLHRIAATTYHEAVPGHHFQIAIEQELGDLPAFRRFGSRLAGGAYVEGWALYTERLASEMGLYLTPLERFGALETEAWRAVRLVVDTGIHALGWTRQQSIDLLQERAGLALLEAETETDRYISWPGQALSYMIGQREILELRAQLQERDGERFDLRAFHDEVIGHGALPLSTLREHLPGWVKPTRPMHR
jgi:uncharacterized protein (DUF885 family)